MNVSFEEVGELWEKPFHDMSKFGSHPFCQRWRCRRKAQRQRSGRKECISGYRQMHLLQKPPAAPRGAPQDPINLHGHPPEA